MALDEHLEYTTPKGYLIRLNTKHGTYLVFENGVPLATARAGVIHQIHPLNQIIFLGESFDFTRHSVNTIGFYDVDRSFMKIPFHFAGLSSTQYVRIPVLFDGVDQLPAVVLYSRFYWPGPLPAINQGNRYFVADPQIPREIMVRLKTKYPKCRIIVYRPDKMHAVKLQGQEPSMKKRAVDLLDNEEALLLAQNPVFAARVYLRRLEWKRMFTLPLFGLLDEEALQAITSFLATMVQNKEKPELAPHADTIHDLLDFYQGLLTTLERNMPKLMAWKSSLARKRQILQYFLPALEAQRHFWLHEENPKHAAFLEDAKKLMEEEMQSGTLAG
ncbi:MAG: hypothetical protein NZM25_11875 [Leptospiraceae bacterium]|nr:hypothetical protein [Leptospiraceae bacterium]MDW8307690.1 hypothetical protein [Leptospiraceae bacterium]